MSLNGYTDADVLLLAHTDTLHGTLSGPATKKLMERVFEVFGERRYHMNAVDCVTQYEAVATCERISNDNAQVESKNGAVVRKHFGYSHIPQRFARLVNAFCRDHLNPYVNFHRLCLFAEIITDAKGRQRKRYPYKLMMTPYEKLKSLPKAKQFLKRLFPPAAGGTPRR